MNRLTRKMRLALTAHTPMERREKPKRWTMRRPVVAVSGATLGAGLFVGYLCGLVSFSETARATPAAGVTSMVLAQGRLPEIHTNIKTDVKTGDKTDTWEAELRTKGASDLMVLENRVEPGGTYGWHKHPGPSLVIIKSGTATMYMGHDPSCTPLVLPAGSSFVDSGNDVHMVRNEGSEELVQLVTSIIPAGATRRIDQPDPGHCP
jgi:quercetin dioxygenase-like cupin family protein